MADNSSGSRGKSEFLKRLTTGKTLCSEVNKASSNAKFLHMRRLKAFVNQLESAKQSMLVENQRAQKDMRRQLDVYKRRKRCIFRERVLSHQQSCEEDVEEEEGEGAGGRTGMMDLPVLQSQRSATSLSTRSRGAGGGGGGGGVKSLGLPTPPPPHPHPPSLPASRSGRSTAMFPAILRIPVMTSNDESIYSAIQRQLQQQMRKQESMHAQILRSRVYDFCNDMATLQEGLHSFYITSPSPKRRIAFSEGTKAAAEPQAGTSLPGNFKTALSSVVV